VKNSLYRHARVKHLLERGHKRLIEVDPENETVG
jgi:hypothetical protein